MVVGSIFDGCSDSCGYTAAAIAAVAYGSFGVPIKETKSIDVHPLVLQSYKTSTMFVMGWLVLLMGVEPSWTPWGLLSGSLWVIGGTAGVFAIRAAGMAVAVGTWASVMIAVNFVWGILVFGEPVSDIGSTLAAFALLTLGLIGMSVYSAPQPKIKSDDQRSRVSDESFSDHSGDDLLRDEERSEPILELRARRSELQPEGERNFVVFEEEEDEQADLDEYRIGNLEMTKRMAGILGAVINGLMSGSSLIPVHYAKRSGYGGANFMISYASGALVANCLIWLLFFAYIVWRHDRLDLSGSLLWQSYQSMPKWHLRQLWLPGLSAGVLLTIAMFGSILSVTYLGQGIGNSIIQSKIVISGLWGIFWYKEITGTTTVTKWFLAATVSVAGILWLSAERMTAAKEEGHDHLFLL